MQATTPLWVPIIVAALGVAGAVTAALLTQLLSKRREDERWQRDREEDRIRWQREKEGRLRELRIRLYVDLSEYAERSAAFFDAVTSEYHFNPSAPPDPPVHHEKLTGQVKLLAAQYLQDAWREFRVSEEGIVWELLEGSPSHDPSGRPYLDADAPNVSLAKTRLTKLEDSLRVAINDLGAEGQYV
ncbi:hypothetical protein ACQPWR_00125 [Micromonospora vinacea]|uniref:hypothetical protein n=1 Tax=Micromonospora vinacea TaxID=709878 RepID=UPI003D944F45